MPANTVAFTHPPTREAACRVKWSISWPTFSPARSTFFGCLGISLTDGSEGDSASNGVSADAAALRIFGRRCRLLRPGLQSPNEH